MNEAENDLIWKTDSSSVEIRFKDGWKMGNRLLMRLSPLALTFTWNRWIMTGGGWELKLVGVIFT